MSFERRLNGLEHKLSPQGSGDSCWKCGGLPARSARLLVVKNLDEVGKCQQCELSVGPDGRPWGTRGAEASFIRRCWCSGRATWGSGSRGRWRGHKWCR